MICLFGVGRPLAGTRARGATSEEDVALEADLLADEKECAEHVMLVDLGRNDVGRVSLIFCVCACVHVHARVCACGCVRACVHMHAREYNTPAPPARLPTASNHHRHDHRTSLERRWPLLAPCAWRS